MTAGRFLREFGVYLWVALVVIAFAGFALGRATVGGVPAHWNCKETHVPRGIDCVYTGDVSVIP